MKIWTYKTLLFLLLTPFLYADEYASFISAQYEIRDFDNSKQKDEGVNKVFTLKQRLNKHDFHLAYERTETQTKPHIPKDLKVNKFYARYAYKLQKNISMYGGYIYIDDNLVSTDGGRIYSLGMEYKPRKPLAFEISAYYGDYPIMKTYQLDLKLTYKHRFEKLQSITVLDAKQISVTQCNPGSICSKAQDYYLTPGFRQKFVYDGYYAGMGAYFSKRAFAVMHDGFRVQHHAMEFEKTMMGMIGKKIKGFDLSLSYIYQEAEELPSETKNVEVRNTLLLLGYSF